MNIEILSPVTTIDPSESFSFSPRLQTLAGKRIGLLDNGKQNSRAVLEHLGSVITATYPTASITFRTKPLASRAVSPEMLTDLQANCDLVIAGIGD